MKIKLLSFIIAFIPAMMTLSAQDIDYTNKEFLSDVGTEYWENGDFKYIRTYLGYLLNDEFYLEHLENEEKTMAYLYAGLAGVKGSDYRDSTRIYIETAAKLATETYGSCSMYEGLSLLGLGGWYSPSDTKKALEYDRQALDILSITCGENAIETAAANAQYAYHLAFSGAIDEADKQFGSAEKRFRQGGWDKTLWHARSLSERAVLRVMQKNGNAAIADLDASINILQPILEAYNAGRTEVSPLETFIYCLGLTVYVYNSTGLYKEAAEMGNQALELMTQAGLEQSSDYAANLSNIGTAYIMMKDFKTATQWYTKAKTHYESIGKTDDVGYKNVVNALNWLATQQ